MSKGSNALVQQLLTAESEAEKIVKQARENRVKKLKDAMVAAEEEINIFKQKEEAQFQREFEERYGKEDTTQSDLDQVTAKELKLVERDYKAHKSSVVSLLIDTTVKVDMKLERVQKRFLTEKAMQSTCGSAS